jgi:hypothetical protein
MMITQTHLLTATVLVGQLLGGQGHLDTFVSFALQHQCEGSEPLTLDQKEMESQGSSNHQLTKALNIYHR